MIYCIGDSHISLFSGEDTIQPVWPATSNDQLPWFKTYHIGAALAYNLPREGTHTQGREKLFEILSKEIPDGATVLLSFGEIDCRAHLVKQAEKSNLPISEVVDSCLNEYFKVIHEVVELGYQVIVYNAVLSRPRARGTHRINDNDYATHGTIEERSQAIRAFNSEAKKRCCDSGVYFLDNVTHLANQSDTISTWYFFDSIHFSQRAIPATLKELTSMIPSLEIEVSILPNATVTRRFGDWLVRRKKRLLKEFGKLWK